MKRRIPYRPGRVAARLLGIAPLAVFCPAQAEPVNPALTQRHEFILGAYNQSSDIAVAAALKGNPRRSISLDDLGVDDHYLSWLLGYRWRFRPRWTLVANAYINRVSGAVENRTTFEYDGQQYEAGATLESRFSSDTYMLDLMYSVLETDRFELQLGGGVHVFDMEVGFDATLALNEASRRVTSSSNDLLAPLPNLRMELIYALSDRWALRLNTGWLSADVDTWDGDYLYGHLRTDYRFGSGFGIGVGYQMTDMQVDHRSDQTLERYDFQYSGPTVYLSYAF